MCIRPSTVAYPTRQQSRIKNGSMLAHGDGRSRGARRLKELFNSFAADLGPDLSEADRTLVRMAATLALKSEAMASDLANGRDVPADDLIKISGTIRRTLASLRAKAIERKPGAGDALAQYLAKRAATQAAAEVDDEESDGEES